MTLIDKNPTMTMSRQGVAFSHTQGQVYRAVVVSNSHRRKNRKRHQHRTHIPVAMIIVFVMIHSVMNSSKNPSLAILNT